jgi:hypothetical protein
MRRYVASALATMLALSYSPSRAQQEQPQQPLVFTLPPEILQGVSQDDIARIEGFWGDIIKVLPPVLPPIIGILGRSVQLQSSSSIDPARAAALRELANDTPDVVARNFLCHAVCDMASAATAAACGTLTSGVAVAACVASTGAAREECPRNC